ncbi:hypothetical protein P5V15_014746 [Pogonomyrmex californicus]
MMTTTMLSYMSKDSKNDNGYGDLLLDDKRERVYVKTLDVDYEDIDSLNNLDADNTMQCEYYTILIALYKMYSYCLIDGQIIMNKINKSGIRNMFFYFFLYVDDYF